MPAGRPTKYDSKYCDELIKYFSVEPYRKSGKQLIPNDPPTLAGFATLIDVCRDTLHEWADKHKEFSDSCKKAKSLQEQYFVVNGMLGIGSTAFTIFAMKNVCGWRDKQEIEHDVADRLVVGLQDRAKNQLEAREAVIMTNGRHGKNGKS